MGVVLCVYVCWCGCVCETYCFGMREVFIIILQADPAVVREDMKKTFGETCKHNNYYH